MIVTGPAEPDEFDHHPRFRSLIDRGAIVLVPRGASEDAYADTIVSVLERPSHMAGFDFDGGWQDVARAVQAQFAKDPATETAPDNAGRTPPAET